MAPVLRWIVPLLLVLSGLAWADEGPSADDVAKVRAKLQSARDALNRQGDKLNSADRQLLSSKLSEAEQALARFDELVARGKERAAATTPLVAAGGALVLDDATGVGTVDDVLLPFVGLGLLAAYLATKPPAPAAEVQAAWQGVIAAIQNTAVASKNVKVQAPAQATAATKKADGCYCRCFKKGEGPLIHERVASPEVCRDYCSERRYPGYQCGGAVIWP